MVSTVLSSPSLSRHQQRRWAATGPATLVVVEGNQSMTLSIAWRWLANRLPYCRPSVRLPHRLAAGRVVPADDLAAHGTAHPLALERRVQVMTAPQAAAVAVEDHARLWTAPEPRHAQRVRHQGSLASRFSATGKLRLLSAVTMNANSRRHLHRQACARARRRWKKAARGRLFSAVAVRPASAPG